MKWKAFLEIGSQYVQSKSAFFRLKAINCICGIVILLCVIDNIIYWATGILNEYYILACLLVVVLTTIVLGLHSLGKFLPAKILISSVIFAIATLGYLTFPPLTNYEIIYLAISPSVFITLQGERKLTFFFFSLYVTAFLTLSFFHIEPILYFHNPLNEALSKPIINCYALFCSMVAFFIIYRFNILNQQEVQEREQDLLQTQIELQQANHLKSNFLANMSHEIRTPMNGILGFSKLLTESDLPKEQAQYAEIVHEGSRQLLAVVNDVLDFSKIETGQVTVVEEILDVQKLNESLRLLFGKSIGDKGLVGTCILPAEHYKLRIKTDAQKVRQILTNLISNAIKFTEEGHVKLHTTISEDEQFIRFSVQDSGIGIAACDQTTVFERFQRVKLAKGQIIEGTGLGLTISKNYAELMGGTLTLVSELGVGSTFTLSIPYQPVSANALNNQYAIQNEKQVRAGCTILLAEDVMFNTLLIQKLLQNSNVKLYCVQDGKAAVEFVQTHPEVDIVLMDIMMPVLDGRLAMQAIKKYYPNLPIIALTAFGMNDEKIELLDEGFDDFIAKPIQGEQLIKSINVCLQKVSAEQASRHITFQ